MKLFLTAEWKYLAMLNYEVDPSILASRVPKGCELDSWNGKTFVSMVGFLFLKTKVLGLPIPFHRNFEEVNLRFYVRQQSQDGWRRGVVFVKELVPRWAIATVARKVYGENYWSLPMRHQLEKRDDASTRLEYEWKHNGNWEGMSATISGEPALSADDAEETFITEHYWGYSEKANGTTFEYQVEHPRWNVWRACDATLQCDAQTLYGPEFADALAGEPSTAFVADGSAVAVHQGKKLVF